MYCLNIWNRLEGHLLFWLDRRTVMFCFNGREVDTHQFVLLNLFNSAELLRHHLICDRLLR